eukprot:TRINITY_DN63250_c0_g1_i1.p1 TRINITY_DN63250_c0_g1~~TRINITY_DN63250_c0_g1_i1.p1  ORF type:complete len:235 (+),score=24.25 TRINITY_DN63250_c0_g1_i1:498-1202(+)
MPLISAWNVSSLFQGVSATVYKQNGFASYLPCSSSSTHELEPHLGLNPLFIHPSAQLSEVSLNMIRICQFIFFIVLVSSAYSEGTSPDFCVSFFEECVLRFEDQTTLATFPLVPTIDNVAFTPALVFPDEIVGIGNSNDVIPQFIESTSSGVTAVNVTDFGLSPTQFKPFTIINTTMAGIGHETFQRGVGVAQGRCVRVFFTSGQFFANGTVFNPAGSGEEVVEDDICIVFRTS